MELKDALGHLPDFRDRDHRGGHAVVRADNGGTEYVVIDGLSEEFANAIVNWFERYQHHQTYWTTVDPAGTSP